MLPDTFEEDDQVENDRTRRRRQHRYHHRDCHPRLIDTAYEFYLDLCQFSALSQAGGHHPASASENI
jgi:hypothetical protein